MSFLKHPLSIYCSGLLLLSVCLCSSRDTYAQAAEGSDQISVDEFFSILESARARFRTIQLQFKSTWSRVGKPPHGVYSGKWHYRNDGYERLEVSKDGSVSGEPSTSTVDIRTPSIQKNVTNVSGRLFGALGVPSKHHWRGTDYGMPGNVVFPIEQHMPSEDHIRQTFRCEGSEAIDGRNCLKVSYEPFPVEKPEYTPRLFFWVDRERDNWVVRQIFTRGGKKEFLTNVRLDQIAEGMWFPTGARLDVYAALSPGSTVPEEEPTVIAEFVIDPASIQIDKELDNSLFGLAFQLGTEVSNHDTGQHYVEGGVPQQGVNSPSPTQEQLDANLQQASDQAAAIEAASLARSQYRNWPYWVLGTLSLAGVVAGIILILRSRFFS